MCGSCHNTNQLGGFPATICGCSCCSPAAQRQRAADAQAAAEKAAAERAKEAK